VIVLLNSSVSKHILQYIYLGEINLDNQTEDILREQLEEIRNQKEEDDKRRKK